MVAVFMYQISSAELQAADSRNAKANVARIMKH
jgi:hypothetical protein